MTDTEKPILFPVGKVVGFHGLRGEIKIRPSTNNPDLLLDVTSVEIVGTDGKREVAAVKDLRIDRRLLLLSLDEYKDRTAVERFIDADVFARRDQLRGLEESEWWISDLVGLAVYTTEGRFIGTICSIIDGANQLLEIAEPDGKRTALVPFVKDLVPLVDIPGGRVEICDIPGLIDFS